MSPFRESSHRRIRGFTLVEILIATSVSAIIAAGLFSAYLFLGRNLTRLSNLQELQVADRQAIYLFTQDLSAAKAITSASDTQLVLKDASDSSVTYSYASGALSREGSVILSGLSTFDFNYYDKAGNAATVLIKFADFTYTATLGTANGGTQVNYTGVSPRVMLRNTDTQGLLPP